MKQIEPKINRLFKQVESMLKELFKDKLKKIILFGSYSRGDHDKESDVDILALVEESQPGEKHEDKILDIMVDLSLENDVVLSLFLEDAAVYEKSKSVKPLLRNIDIEGIELYAA